MSNLKNIIFKFQELATDLNELWEEKITDRIELQDSNIFYEENEVIAIGKYSIYTKSIGNAENFYYKDEVDILTKILILEFLEGDPQ